jgi:mono/diheme cytochrome c family protein
MMLRVVLAICAVMLFIDCPGAHGQAPSASFANPSRFLQRNGEDIYRSVCQGCHMPDGRGAVGAGAYPALAANPKLEASGYPVLLVINGQGAMPAFKRMLDDEQIAAVVNYVRTHFGNTFNDAVSGADVKNMR